MVPPSPRTALKMIEANLLLEFSVVHFDSPSPLCEANKAAHSERLAWQLCQPIFRWRRGALWPFHQALDRMIWEAAAGGPSMSDPDFTAGKPRLKAATTASPPTDGLPTRRWQRASYAQEIERLGQLLDRSAFARTTPPATRRNGSIGRRGPSLRGGYHLDAVGQSPIAQGFPKVGAVAVPGIRQDHSRPHSPSEHAIQPQQRQVVLRAIGDLLRNADLSPPLGIADPLFGQIQFPGQRRAAAIGAEMDRHRHLAVRRFSQSATVLTTYADRVNTLFGKAGLVDDQDGFRQQPVHQVERHSLLNRLPGPRTLVDELLQTLGIGLPDASGNRLDRLALPLHQKAANVDRSPFAALRAPEERDFVCQERLQPALCRSQRSRVHAAIVRPNRPNCNVD